MKNLLIINVLVFLLTLALRTRGIIDLDDVLALHYWQSPKFKVWQLVTHLFMHGSWEHIFFNMFALWMFGRILENTWGPRRFLLFYMVCGVGAALCHLGVLTFEFTRFSQAYAHYMQHPTAHAFQEFLTKYVPNFNPAALNGYDAQQSVYEIGQYYTNNMLNEATVGASGAIMGLLFAFGYLYPNTMLYVYFAIPVKAKWFVAVYALVELYSGIQNSAGDNIAHFAHLGGMLFAFIMLRIWNKKIRNQFY